MRYIPYYYNVIRSMRSKEKHVVVMVPKSS